MEISGHRQGRLNFRSTASHGLISPASRLQDVINDTMPSTTAWVAGAGRFLSCRTPADFLSREKLCKFRRLPKPLNDMGVSIPPAEQDTPVAFEKASRGHVLSRGLIVRAVDAKLPPANPPCRMRI